MSHHASSWAIEQTPRTAEGKPDAYGKLLLLVLADLASQEGVLWHGSRRIAEQACMPAESVRKVLGRLVAGGYVARIDRFRQDGSQTTSLLVLAPNGDRGGMRDPRSHDRFGAEIAGVLQPPTPVTQPPGPVTQVNPGSEPVIEPVSEPVVVARANERDMKPITDALQAAGFDQLAIETNASAIRLAVESAQPPADVDWFAFGVRMESKRRSGEMRTANPAQALKFMFRGLGALPRVGGSRSRSDERVTDAEYDAAAERLARVAAGESEEDVYGSA